MPPPTSSQKPGPKLAPAPAASNGKAAAAAGAGGSDEASGRPDQEKYNAEQDAINSEIAAVKVKLDAVRSRIELSKAPKGNDRRSQVRSEMDSLRSEQGGFKAERGKLLDELRKLQDALNKKIKDVQAQRAKTGIRNVAELDERIRTLDAQVESGSMKLVEEKKALQEISTLKRARKTFESSSFSEEAIAADKERIDELKKQLDDPEAKKVSARFDELKKEMDGLRAEGDKAYQERNKLFDERTALSKQLDDLYGKKRETAQAFHDAKDKYHAKVQAIRQARNDRYKAERAKEDEVRRNEEIAQMREDAKLPAYAAEIEDCRILINYFGGKYGAGEVPETSAGTEKKNQPTLAGVKALEIRQVSNDLDGLVIRKKKDEDLEGFFGGSGGKKKKGGNKKGGAAASSATSGAATPSAANESVNLPMHLLSALLSFGISPPSNKEDVQRTITDLETKKSWFDANSESKTKEEIARVEKVVAKMEKKNKSAAADGDAEADAADEADEADEATEAKDAAADAVAPEEEKESA